MQFRVEALEKFTVRTVYHVKAKDAREAEERCQTGHVAYHEKEIEEGDEQWLETVSVECEGDDDNGE